MRSPRHDREPGRGARPRQGSARGSPAGRRRELEADLRLDGRGEVLVGRHEDGRGVGAVLGLAEEVRRDMGRVGGSIGEHHHLRRAGGEIDADLAEDLELGRGDPGVTRSDDPVDWFDAVVGQPVSERPDRLGTPGDHDGVDLEQAGDPEEDRIEGSVGPGRRGDDEGADAGDASRHTRTSRGSSDRRPSRPGRMRRPARSSSSAVRSRCHRRSSSPSYAVAGSPRTDRCWRSWSRRPLGQGRAGRREPRSALRARRSGRRRRDRRRTGRWRRGRPPCRAPARRRGSLGPLRGPRGSGTAPRRTSACR